MMEQVSEAALQCDDLQNGLEQASSQETQASQELAPQPVAEVQDWQALGMQAQTAAKSSDWAEVERLARLCSELRHDWHQIYRLWHKAMVQLGRPVDDIAEVLRIGMRSCPKEWANGSKLRSDLAALEPPGKLNGNLASKARGLKLLPYEKVLLESRLLEDKTHEHASYIWLKADSARLSVDSPLGLVYRPMGEEECAFLFEHGELPPLKYYGTIVRDEPGRDYCELYMSGRKKVDVPKAAVVEFAAPLDLISRLFEKQSKNEDGVISHGLGDTGGRGLDEFNRSLQEGQTHFRVVTVKRAEKKAEGAFGAGRTRH